MKRLILALALIAQATLSAAGGEQKKPKDPTPEEVLQSYDERHPERIPFRLTALSIGTWNVMLQPWLPYESKVIEVLKKTNLDVLDLEAVWTEEARNRILAAVAKKYRYSYWSPTVQRTAGCFLSAEMDKVRMFDGGVEEVSEQGVDDYVSCLISTGTDTRTVEQPVSPVDPFCSFLGLNIALEDQPCFECIANTMQNLSAGDPGAFGATTLCGQANGVKYSHQGNVGRLILSKWPISDVEDVPFTTYSIRRVNTYATIRGVRFAFTHWPKNYLAETDPSLGPLQTGALQTELAQDALVHLPGVIMGSFNSGPDYQPEGHNVLTQGNFRPLFTNTQTYCPAQLQDFPPCGDAGAVPASIDNIFLAKNTGACLKTTFANEDQSDHIGLAALCILKTQ
jgi:hypothetical protein